MIWDSGASFSLSPYKEDFVGPIKPAPIGLTIRGIAKGLVIAGVGHVAWTFEDEDGMLRTFKVPAYFVPKASIRLLSIPSLLQTYPSKIVNIASDFLLFKDAENETECGIKVTFDPKTNLPTSYILDHHANSSPEVQFNNLVTTTSASNHNLGPAAKELLRWHHRLGHLDYRKIQFLLRTGVLAHSESQ